MTSPGSGVQLLSSCRSTVRWPTLLAKRVVGPLGQMPRQVLRRKLIAMPRQSSSMPPPSRRVGLSRIRLSQATLNR